MKTFLHIIALLLVLSLTSCDVNYNEVYNNSGYINLTYSFVNLDAKNYNVTFNKQKIDSYRGLYLPVNKANGTIEVYNKLTNNIEYSEQVSLNADNSNIQFIQLPGKNMEVYHPNDYTSFKLIVFYSGNASDFIITFNNNELINGLNYIRKDVGLTGLLEIHKKNESIPLYSQKIEIKPDVPLTLLQLSSNEFIEVTDNEPDPATKDSTKIRFFYTQDAIPKVKSVKLVIYFMAYEDYSTTPIDTIEFDANRMSPYVEVKSSMSGAWIYDLIDKANPNHKIVDNARDMSTSIAVDVAYKKQTFRITDISADKSGGDNVMMDIINNLSTRW